MVCCLLRGACWLPESVGPHRLDAGAQENSSVMAVLQDAQLKAWRGLNVYDGRASFRTWMFKGFHCFTRG